MDTITFLAMTLCNFALFATSISSRENTVCVEQSLVGENNISIFDSSYTASSYFDFRYAPYKAKLYGKYGWAARYNSNPDDYLQIDLGTPRVITAVATQGNGGDPEDDHHNIKNEWVKTYKLSYSIDSSRWINYTDGNGGQKKLFPGNTDSNSVVRHNLTNPQLVRYIRFIPVGYRKWKAMRINVYFSDQKPPRVTSIPYQRSIQLTWTYKRCSPTDHITGYLVKVGNRTQQVINHDLRYNWTNLKPYTEYNVSVKAITQQGHGVWSNTSTTTTTIAEPEAIPILNVKEDSSETIVLKWKLQSPESINGPLKGYRITYTPQGGETKTVDVGADTTYNLTSLMKYTTYNITVAVNNTKYIGPPSTVREVRTMEDAPSAPTNVSGTVILAQGSVGSRILITWGRPRDLNGIIRKYTIVYYYNMDPSNKTTVSINVNSTSDLRYLMDTTVIGILSYKISATTIKEGPYQSGNNLTILLHVKKNQHAEQKPSSFINDNRFWMIAGLVAGFIVMLLLLVFGIVFCKRRHHFSKRELEAKEEEPHSVPLAAMVVDVTSTQDHDYLDFYESSLLDEGNNTEDKMDEETEISTHPDLSFDQTLINFVPPDEKMLTQEFKSIPVEPKYESTIAKKPANKIKNRYKNIVAYDHSLVTLEQVDNDPNSCYINASFIRGYNGTPAAYIATQGPLSNTTNDFWRMIWEQNISSILMLTNLLELGKKKCYQYWPDKSAQYSGITVTNHKTEVFADFVVRTFLLSKGDISNRKVLQFHFTTWPDKGVPDHATAVLAFRRKVLALSAGDNIPMAIHCSAGVGRTGTYIIIDAMLREAQNEQNVDIIGYLHAIRDDRPYMVQTLEQYIFVHMAVHEALTCGNTEIQVNSIRIVMQQLSTVDKRHNLSGYAMEFQRLEAATSQIARGNFDVGLAKDNIKKNRYSNIVTTNESRVILSTDEDHTVNADYVNTSTIHPNGKDSKGDYINASFVDTYREHNAFIMTQAPMENTIADFWRMVMDYEIGTIVMLNNLQEEFESFPRYWPAHGTKKYGDVTVELLDTKDLGKIITRQFRVTKKGTRRTLCHLQYLIWPNKCIPADPQTVLKLLSETQKSQQKSGNSPIVVQCSNGIGRSGTFCAIASCLERVKQEQVLDVFQTVKSIRVNRPGAVETLTQYVFCYNIIQKYLDSFSDYANFGDKY